MPYELRSLPFFQRDLEKICGLFPKSAAAIRALIKDRLKIALSEL